MADGRQTPEPLPLTDFNPGAEELAQRTIPRVMRETSIDKMWELLGNSKKEMDRVFRILPTLARSQEKLAETSSKTSPEFVYTVYLNLLSDMVHEELAKGAEKHEKKMYFFDRHNHAAEDHPTGTIDRPDFLARRDDEKAALKFHWSALEAAGELLSGKASEHLGIKTVSYTSYLLQARPDRLIVQGISVGPGGFKLVVSSACGASTTKRLDWPSRDSRLLLCAWIWRLYRPVVDPSITTTIEGDKRPTFKIELPGDGGIYNNCTILTAGSAFGRRTIVFRCPEDPNIIIKEQFIEKLRRFEEADILTQIHKAGTFPGVVRLGWHGSVKSEKEGEELVVQCKDPKTGKISSRKKTRLVLLDKGATITDAETLLEALIAIYDVLEITRFLHTKRGVLHRDISVNNVLLRATVSADTSSADIVHLPDAVVAQATTSSADNVHLPDSAPVNTSADAPLTGAVPANASFAKDLRDMCFASHLLKTKSKDQSVGRLDTNVLLIDFDMGEAQEYSDPNKKGPHSRTGTPTFMARTVVSATKKRGKYNLEPMPRLESHQGREIYEAAVPTRLADFPPNQREFSEILANKKLEPFKHKLQYDGESVFWVLVWWAIRALPADDTSPNHKEINNTHWIILTSGDDQEDARNRFFPNFPDNVLHPVYKPLEPLLQQMAEQVWGYHEEGEEPSRKKDEYLHEAFQRIIFKFLFTHYDESFMTVKKSRESRKPAKVDAMRPPLAPSEVERTRARSSAATEPTKSSSSMNLRSGLKRKINEAGASGSDEDHGEENYKPSRPQQRRRKSLHSPA